MQHLLTIPPQTSPQRFIRRTLSVTPRLRISFCQSVSKSSHPALSSDTDLLEHLRELVPGRRGLDAGCGAGARDVYYFWQHQYDIYGIDVIEENIQRAKTLHPEISDRVAVADLRQPLDFPDLSFDFVICNAVIQHIEPRTSSTPHCVNFPGVKAEWHFTAHVKKRPWAQNSIRP